MPRVAAEPRYLTAGQAARLLGVSPKTLTRWADDRRIACSVTLGGHRRFATETIEAVAVSMRFDGDKPVTRGDRPADTANE